MLPFICFDGRVNASERYVPVYQNMGWTEAQRYCREYFTDLASVRNETENQKIRSLKLNNTYYSIFWIGLYRTMTWSDKSNSSFSNWRPGQPNSYGQTKICTAVSNNDNDYYYYYYGTWTDENCGEALPFFCYSTMPSLPSRQYHFVNENKTWTEAQRYCRENYTDLATIDNMEEMNTLLDTVNGSYSGLGWIGLYGDVDSWRWSLEDDAFYQEGERDFRGWPHQPDNYNGNELCVYINYDGAWFDGNCNSNLPFVCYDAMPSASSHQYHFVNEYKTWTEAQRYCRENYTDLATIDNMEEMNTLLSTVNGSYSGLAWIGLYDDLDSWRWSLDDDAFYQEGERDFRGWEHQPDNYNGQELCVSMNRLGEWFDRSCKDRKEFVCYNGTNTYVDSYYSMTWEEAQRYCRENYIDLASVRNENEVQQILNIMYSYEVGQSQGHVKVTSTWMAEPKVSQQKIAQGMTLPPPARLLPIVHPGAMCSAGFLSLAVCLPRQYQFINENKTWSEAQRYCRENYVDLAFINNTEEDLALANIIGIRKSRRTWIGLYDDLNSWKWSLDNDSFYKEGERSFRNWYIQKPSY
ncbi:hypothetical protein QTP86_014833 [Hemibagrus guttatus]|nr:hypothetical protein QTP86_014833 [Hemibagrus guttatus]